MLRQISGFAGSLLNGPMQVACIHHGGEAAQGFCGDTGRRADVLLSPSLNCLPRESGTRISRQGGRCRIAKWSARSCRQTALANVGADQTV